MLYAGRPYWDELASSAIARCSRRFNLPLKRLGHQVLGCSGWRMSFAAASPILPIAQMFGLTPDELLWNHTAFPYATAFMTGKPFDRAIRNAMGCAHARVGLASVLQNATSGLPQRQFCGQCVAEELAHTGESFWHRAHNLPGVRACAKHRCALSVCAISASSGPLSLLLPHEVAPSGARQRRIGDAMTEVAIQSHDWLNRPWGPGETSHANYYRQLGITNGWLSGERQANRAALHRLVLASFPASFLRESALPSTIQANEWPALMLRRHGNLPFAPIKHAILRAVLSRTRKQSEPVVDYVSSGPPKTDSARIDSFYAKAARQALIRVIRSAERYTTEQFLRSFGALSPYRHLGDDLPQLRAVVREFRSSEATVKRLSPDKSLYRARNALS